MVRGIDTFRRYFAEYEEQYVLIGGAACDILFESNDAAFRATRDLDMVLIIEALTPETRGVGPVSTVFEFTITLVSETASGFQYSGSAQVVIGAVSEIIRTIRAVIAGFAKFWPSPPKSCFTITIATKLPRTAIQKGSVTGRLSASMIPVTAALRSPIVCSLFIIFRHRYSNTTDEAVHTAISAAALNPKNVTAAIIAGTSETITIDIILRVDISELR